MSTIINGDRDLKTYLQNTRPDIRSDERLVVGVVEAIQDVEHPLYGCDWAGWLDEHLPIIVEQVARNCRRSWGSPALL